MCGIIGCSGCYGSDSIHRGLQDITHRGPDDSGVFMEAAEGIVLGHARLSIIDLSAFGHQPMISDNGQVVIVFNGEIYNYLELRKVLEERGYVFRSHSDTEVLLNLYLAEGEAMLLHLNGVFAFAIWDGRKRSLFIARDAFGVKPLYYAVLGKRFAFSSEIKGLLHLVPEVRDLDKAALQCYLTYLWCPGEGTPLKAVRKLLPGEAMVVKSGCIERCWKWYQLPAFRHVKPVYDKKAALDGTVLHLRQAVHRQMVADVPVGAFLSGGLDSSSIVTFARELNPDIHCFTIGLHGTESEGMADDLPYARKVAKHLNVKLDVVYVDANRMAGDLMRMVRQLDEPLADPAPLNVLYISQLARESGIKVLLSGAGGDDLFTGYRRHLALQSERFWAWLPKQARIGLEALTTGIDQRWPLGRRLRKLFNGASLTGDARLVNYFRWADRQDLVALYSPEFLAELSDSHAEDTMLDFLVDLPSETNRLDRMLALEQRFFLTDHNLTYTDKMSMAVGVEVRVPFLDLDLVDFAYSIPVSMKQRGKEGKWILKKAMEPFLPHDVIYRHKSGFGAPLRHWMRYELRELLGDILSVDSLKRRWLFNPDAVQRLIVANDQGKVDASYTLLSLLCIEMWCRSFIDKQ
jgi:asparagine synthase (glutamine-hydrolysing)